MKSTAKPSLYLSAYPLKAVKESTVNNSKPESPFLRALLSGTTKASSTRVRVLSLTRSQKENREPVSSKGDKLPKDIELTEKDWFKNYE